MHSPISPAVAVFLFSSGNFDFRQWRHSHARQLHRVDLLHGARLAMAFAWPLVLDSYERLPDERPRLRNRMAFSADFIVRSFHAPAVSAQLPTVPVVARINFQRLYETRHASTRRVAMDVAAA